MINFLNFAVLNLRQHIARDFVYRHSSRNTYRGRRIRRILLQLDILET